MTYQVGNVHFFQPESAVKAQLTNLFNNEPDTYVNGLPSDICYLFEWEKTGEPEYWGSLYASYEDSQYESEEDLHFYMEQMKEAVTKYLTENGAGHLLPVNNTVSIPDDLLWE